VGYVLVAAAAAAVAVLVGEPVGSVLNLVDHDLTAGGLDGCAQGDWRDGEKYWEMPGETANDI
jgi:hypothetical protein